MSNAATTTSRTTKPAGAPTKPAGRKPRAAKPQTAKPAKATTKPAPKPAQPTNCKCGCGNATKRANADYVAGHDARHAGVVGRALIAANADHKKVPASLVVSSGLGSLPTPALQAKALGMVRTHAERAAKKAAIAKVRAEAKAAAQKILDAAKA